MTSSHSPLRLSFCGLTNVCADGTYSYSYREDVETDGDATAAADTNTCRIPTNTSAYRTSRSRSFLSSWLGDETNTLLSGLTSLRTGDEDESKRRADEARKEEERRRMEEVMDRAARRACSERGDRSATRSTDHEDDIADFVSNALSSGNGDGAGGGPGSPAGRPFVVEGIPSSADRKKGRDESKTRDQDGTARLGTGTSTPLVFEPADAGVEDNDNEKEYLVGDEYEAAAASAQEGPVTMRKLLPRPTDADTTSARNGLVLPPTPVRVTDSHGGTAAPKAKASPARSMGESTLQSLEEGAQLAKTRTSSMYKEDKAIPFVLDESDIQLNDSKDNLKVTNGGDTGTPIVHKKPDNVKMHDASSTEEETRDSSRDTAPAAHEVTLDKFESSVEVDDAERRRDEAWQRNVELSRDHSRLVQEAEQNSPPRRKKQQQARSKSVGRGLLSRVSSSVRTPSRIRSKSVNRAAVADPAEDVSYGIDLERSRTEDSAASAQSIHRERVSTLLDQLYGPSLTRERSDLRASKVLERYGGKEDVLVEVLQDKVMLKSIDDHSRQNTANDDPMSETAEAAAAAIRTIQNNNKNARAGKMPRAISVPRPRGSRTAAAAPVPSTETKPRKKKSVVSRGVHKMSKRMTGKRSSKKAMVRERTDCEDNKSNTEEDDLKSLYSIKERVKSELSYAVSVDTDKSIGVEDGDIDLQSTASEVEFNNSIRLSNGELITFPTIEKREVPVVLSPEIESETPKDAGKTENGKKKGSKLRLNSFTHRKSK